MGYQRVQANKYFTTKIATAHVKESTPQTRRDSWQSMEYGATHCMGYQGVQATKCLTFKIATARVKESTPWIRRNS